MGRRRTPGGVARARARRSAAGGTIGRLEVQPSLREGLRGAADGGGVRRDGADGAVSLPNRREFFLGECYFILFREKFCWLVG